MVTTSDVRSLQSEFLKKKDYLFPKQGNAPFKTMEEWMPKIGFNIFTIRYNEGSKIRDMMYNNLVYWYKGFVDAYEKNAQAIDSKGNLIYVGLNREERWHKSLYDYNRHPVNPGWVLVYDKHQHRYIQPSLWEAENFNMFGITKNLKSIDTQFDRGRRTDQNIIIGGRSVPYHILRSPTIDDILLPRIKTPQITTTTPTKQKQIKKITKQKSITSVAKQTKIKIKKIKGR